MLFYWIIQGPHHFFLMAMFIKQNSFTIKVYLQEYCIHTYEKFKNGFLICPQAVQYGITSLMIIYTNTFSY